jgi:hypothetical protein
MTLSSLHVSFVFLGLFHITTSSPSWKPSPGPSSPVCVMTLLSVSITSFSDSCLHLILSDLLEGNCTLMNICKVCTCVSLHMDVYIYKCMLSGCSTVLRTEGFICAFSLQWAREEAPCPPSVVWSFHGGLRLKCWRDASPPSYRSCCGYPGSQSLCLTPTEAVKAPPWLCPLSANWATWGCAPIQL